MRNLNYKNMPLSKLKIMLNDAEKNEEYEKAMEINNEINRDGRINTFYYSTLITAVSPNTGALVLYEGDKVMAKSFNEAQKWCKENKPYMKVVGKLISEIPLKDGEADFENEIKY